MKATLHLGEEEAVPVLLDRKDPIADLLSREQVQAVVLVDQYEQEWRYEQEAP